MADKNKTDDQMEYLGLIQDFMDSFKGDPIERGRRKKESGQYDRRKEDDSEGFDFGAFLESFTGDPAERGMRKKRAGQYNEGGMAADVDPVSGNEVPPGSLPEEVRDDIPAMLSEGEYVVPADVLRFYGMKFFEDLRTQAKMGLADMESNGRIGGEPIEGPAMGGGEELTPEERAEIESMVNMAVGGYVPEQKETQQPDPYMQQQAMYDQKKTIAVGNTGYAEGGTVPEDTQVDASNYATRFAPGFTFAEGANAEDFSIVTLYGPGGEVITLTLPADQAKYDDLLEKGYSDDQAAATAAPVTTDTSVGQVQDGGSDDSNSADPLAGQEEKLANPSFDVFSIDSADLASTAARLDTLHKGTKALTGLLPGVAGAAMMTGVSARFNDVIARMDEEGIKHDYERKSNVFGGEGSLYGGLQDTDKSGSVGFGDTWLGDLLGFDGKGGVQGAGLKASRQGARRDTTVSAPTTTNGGGSKPSSNSSSSNSSSSNNSSSNSSSSNNYMPTSRLDSKGSTPTSTNKTSSTPTSRLDSKGSTPSSSSPKKESVEQKISRGGGFKEGGLVNRPTKKKK